MRVRLGWLGWLVLVAACIWLPWHALYEGSGPFIRELSRSRVWKSLGECLLLLGAVYASLRMRRGGAVLALLFAEVYARRHGVDITLLLLGAYLAGIHAMGRCFAASLGARSAPTLECRLRDTLLGLIAWSAMIWVLSLAGFGDLATLRILTLLVLGGALIVWSWRWGTDIALPKRPDTRSGAFLVASFVAIVLMLAAKAAASDGGSDAMWYGLNADRVLFGEGGLFHDQGLVAHVHFYPKFTEALHAPFLGLGSSSLVTGFSLLCWVLLVLTSREVLEELGVEGHPAWYGALVACAVPAVSASAITPKGELLGAWLCLSGLLAYRYGNDGADGNYFIVPIVLLHLAIWTGLFAKPGVVRIPRALSTGTVAIVAFCLFLVLTTANWMQGTRPLDARFDRTPFGELGALAAERFRVSGMGPLADELGRWPVSTRMLGDMPVGDGGHFPVRYESLGTIVWARPPLLADDASIRRLFKEHAIRLVSLSHDSLAAVDDRLRPVLDDMARRGEARKVQLSGCPADLWVLGPAPGSPPSR